MKYYVVSDVHGYYSELVLALTEKGYFSDTEPHKLVICGDLFDRGQEALKMQSFILELLANDAVILIKGNHEEMTLKLLNDWHKQSYEQHSHNANMTVDTVYQLTGTTPSELAAYPDEVGKAFLHTPYIQKIIPSAIDYLETPHYIFVHGWIPCNIDFSKPEFEYSYMDGWRNADEEHWHYARWVNGMKVAHFGVLEKGKTVVCGHYRCSFGHEKYEDGNENDNTPYYSDGIIAIDASTARSGRINCIVIDD